MGFFAVHSLMWDAPTDVKERRMSIKIRSSGKQSTVGLKGSALHRYFPPCIGYYNNMLITSEPSAEFLKRPSRVFVLELE